ncbi:hypothetical protein CONCODRAFT_12333, partial [Conidiobolus coronatus NRRL 28638]
ISFSAPVPKSNSHGSIADNYIRAALHMPQNTCSQQAKIIGGVNVSFDNSCENTAIESDTDDHSNSGNRHRSDDDF